MIQRHNGQRQEHNLPSEENRQGLVETIHCTTRPDLNQHLPDFVGGECVAPAIEPGCELERPDCGGDIEDDPSQHEEGKELHWDEAGCDVDLFEVSNQAMLSWKVWLRSYHYKIDMHEEPHDDPGAEELACTNGPVLAECPDVAGPAKRADEGV